VEESTGEFCAFEFKFGMKNKTKIPQSFSSNYNVKEFNVVTPLSAHLLLKGVEL